MEKNTLPTVLIYSLIVFTAFLIAVSDTFAAASPSLGAAGSYSVLAGSIVTNTGATSISGDLGVSPSIGVPPHVTGFPPGIVGPPGAIHDADAHAGAAQASNLIAFGDLSATPNVACDVTYTGTQDLVGMTLAPGIYCADAFALSGTLILDDTGNSAGVWIFRSSSMLSTTPGVGAKVQFLNGIGSSCNVWWKAISSATLGSGTSFLGNILASTSISLGTGASLNGRALAQTGAVTLDASAVTQCGVCIPGTEICDGIDNNCNGVVDEGVCVLTECEPGASVTRLGQCGQTDVGECSYGTNETRICEPNGVWGEWVCEGAASPVNEICFDGKDNDCDGLVDENCGLPIKVPVMDNNLFILLTLSTMILGLYGFKKYGR